MHDLRGGIWWADGMDRRAGVPRGSFFFTVVSFRHHPLCADPWGRRMLGSVILRCLLREPYSMAAFLLLEDHLHAIWISP